MKGRTFSEESNWKQIPKSCRTLKMLTPVKQQLKQTQARVIAMKEKENNKKTHLNKMETMNSLMNKLHQQITL